MKTRLAVIGASVAGISLVAAVAVLSTVSTGTLKGDLTNPYGSSSHPTEQIILDEVRLCTTPVAGVKGTLRVKYRIGAYVYDEPACYNLVAKSGQNILRDPNAICGKGDANGATAYVPLNSYNISLLAKQKEFSLCLAGTTQCSANRLLLSVGGCN